MSTWANAYPNDWDTGVHPHPKPNPDCILDPTDWNKGMIKVAGQLGRVTALRDGHVKASQS